MNKLSITVATITVAACVVVFFQVRNHRFAEESLPVASAPSIPDAATAAPELVTPTTLADTDKLPEAAKLVAAPQSATPAKRSARSSPPDRMPSAEIISLGDELRRSRDPLQRRRTFMTLIDNLTLETAAEMRQQILRLPENSPEFRDFHFALGQVMGEDAVHQGTETPERDMADSLRGWASVDPAAAYAWFAERIASGEAKFSSGGSGAALVSALASSDLDLATDTAISAGAESAREQQRALYSIASTLARTDGVNEAAEWAATVEAGLPQEAAVQNVARIWAYQDVEDAFEWALGLDDEKLRQSALMQVGQHYVRVDRDVAIRRLQESGLSDEVLKPLTRPPKRR